MMNILLPTDFSENSRNAAAYALEYFKDISCNFYLLHVTSSTPAKLESGHQNIPENIQNEFDDLFTWIDSLKTNADHHFHFCYKVDFLIEAVRQKVAEKKIDLILMGTKGATNKHNKVLGKNTSDVIMKVKCPALAISENAIYKKHQEVLFPTDYKINYSSKMLDSLRFITNLSYKSIRILELFGSDTEPNADQMINRESLKNSFSPDIPEVQTYYSLQNKNHGTLFSTNKNVDMIVMAAKNLNLCQKLLRNKNNTQIPFIRKLPLLILHD